MSHDEPSGPNLANGFVRATKDSDLLVPDGADTDEAILRFLDRAEATRLHDGKVLTAEDVTGAHHLRVMSRHGIIDIIRLAGRVNPISAPPLTRGYLRTTLYA